MKNKNMLLIWKSKTQSYEALKSNSKKNSIKNKITWWIFKQIEMLICKIIWAKSGKKKLSLYIQGSISKSTSNFLIKSQLCTASGTRSSTSFSHQGLGRMAALSQILAILSSSLIIWKKKSKLILMIKFKNI